MSTKENLVIAVDFDGTCVTHEYPNIGKDIGAAWVLKKIVEKGHKIILWTMRSDNREDGSNPLSDAVDWFEKNNIPLYGIQKNPTQDKWTSSPKAYAQLYIDDAALGCPLIYHKDTSDRPFVDWKKVEKYLAETQII